MPHKSLKKVLSFHILASILLGYSAWRIHHTSLVEDLLRNSLETFLHTKVEWTSITQTPSGLEIHNPIIYHQFIQNKAFLIAKKLVLRMHWGEFLKKHPNKTKSHSIQIIDGLGYIDSSLYKQKIIQRIFEKSPKPSKHSFNIEFKNIEFRTDFKEKDSFYARIHTINGHIHTNKDFTRYAFHAQLQGDAKHMYSTNTPIHITGTKRKHSLRGVLDLESLNYLGYRFAGVGIEYRYNSKQKHLICRTGPTTHLPYLQKLPPKIQQSYASGKWEYILASIFEYRVQEERMTLTLSTDNASKAAPTMIKHYINANPIRALIPYFSKGFTYEASGTVQLGFHKARLQSFFIDVKEMQGLVHSEDAVTFLFTGKRKAHATLFDTQFERVEYSSPYGSLTGSCVFNDSKYPQEARLVLRQVIPSRFLPFSLEEQSITHKVLHSPLSTNITLSHIDQHTHFTLTHTTLNNTQLPSIQGVLTFYGGRTTLAFKDLHDHYSATLSLQHDPKQLDFHCTIQRLDYKTVQQVVSLNPAFKGLSLQGQIRGRLPFNTNHGLTFQAQIEVLERSKQKGATQDPKERVHKKASFDVHYQDSQIFIQNAHIYSIGLRSFGTLRLEGQALSSDLMLECFGTRIHMSGRIAHLQSVYKTALVFSYNQFQEKLTFEGDIQLKNSLDIVWKQALIRYNATPYHTNAHIAIKHHPDPKHPHTIIQPNISLHSHRTHNISGTLHHAHNTLTTDLLYTWGKQAQDSLTLRGHITEHNKALTIMFTGRYSEEVWRSRARISWTSRALTVDAQVEGFGVPLGLYCVFEKKEGRLYLNGSLTLHGHTIPFQGHSYTQGNTLFHNLELQYKDHRILLEGYISHRHRKYFPYYRILHYSPWRKEAFQYRIEGILTDTDTSFKIQGACNQSIHVYGTLTKYSALDLQVYFNTHPLMQASHATISTHPRAITMHVSREKLQVEGTVALNALPVLYNASISTVVTFNYSVPMQELIKKNYGHIEYKSIAITRDTIPLFLGQGQASYAKNTWKLFLHNTTQNFFLDINYNHHTDTIHTHINLTQFDMNTLHSQFKGILDLSVQIEGTLASPILKIQKLSIQNGQHKHTHFDGYVQDLLFTQTTLRVSQSLFTVNNARVFLSNLHYQYDKQKQTPESPPIEKRFSLKFLKVTHNNYELQCHKLHMKTHQDIPIPRLMEAGSILSATEILWDFTHNILTHPSEITAHAILVSSQEVKAQIEQFRFLSGKDWRINLEVRVRALLLENLYQGKMHILGGRNNQYAELNINASHLVLNNEKQAEQYFILENLGKRWDILPNSFGVLGYFLLDDTHWEYSITMTQQNQSYLNTRGNINTQTQNLQLSLKTAFYDIDLKKLAPNFVHQTSGTLTAELKVSGSTLKPVFEGYINLKQGTFKTTHYNIANVTLSIQLTADKKYTSPTTLRNYSHALSITLEYNDTPIAIRGFFNLNVWALGAYELRCQISQEKPLNNISIKNNLFEYTGALSYTLDLTSHQHHLELTGTVYLEQGELKYIGETSDEESLFDLIHLAPLHIHFKKDVLVYLGTKKVSFGEAEIEPGSTLIITKKGTQLLYLNGRIPITQGYFDYLGNIFTLSHTEFIWQNSTNPLIQAEAYTKIQDEYSQFITIFFNINTDAQSIFRADSSKDQPGDYFLGSFSSVPQKSPTELALLLGLAQDEETQQYLSSQERTRIALGKTTNTFLNIIFVKPLEQKIRKLFGGAIDTVTITQNILHNTLIKQEHATYSHSVEPYNKQLPSQYDTQISLGKHITKDIRVSAGVILKQNAQNTYKSNVEPALRVGLETNLLSLFGVQSTTMSLENSIEYRYYPLNRTNKHEGASFIRFTLQF